MTAPDSRGDECDQGGGVPGKPGRDQDARGEGGKGGRNGGECEEGRGSGECVRTGESEHASMHERPPFAPGPASCILLHSALRTFPSYCVLRGTHYWIMHSE